MGYYSTLYCDSFKIEDCQKAETIFQRYQKEDPNGYFFYLLEIDECHKMAEIIPEGNEYTAKHYEDERLAKAISEIIAPGESVDLTFDGEDGTKWGYRISKGKIVPLSCVFLTQEEEYIVKKYKKKDINAVKFILGEYINRFALAPNEFAEAMMDLHPTLQQNLMRVFMAWCQKMAELPPYDARNKASVKLAKEIVKIAKDISLPFV